MLDHTLYSAILGLSSEWNISHVTMDEQTGITEIHIRNHKGGIAPCPCCGSNLVQAGTQRTRWLHESHLNFRFVVSALVPVMSCESCGEVKLPMPWDQSRFKFLELESEEHSC
ncbi:hypothetical protein [Pelotalea chapellei]|uniref:Zinc-finger of transposase IS204/IS1001/IS1096/IS1165 n=1 Tax=Pelotalea chapellei TaxID=44671 RepID=A0ABS5UCJ1_9BACT|nr:hypothetical protein [Pelotalea chapellei]MBT1073201.1 hypothetical protein [Pelotalea chapellei]